MKVENRSLFNFAHSVVEAIRRGEKAVGDTLSNYGATFQLALKAIRESKTNAELQERLAQLAGRGGVIRLPRRPILLPGDVEAPQAPKKKPGS